MSRYGLVFKTDNQCWLSEYVDGTIKDASPLDDHNKIYEDLNPREMSLVEIFHEEDVNGGERVSLQDLKTITITNEEFPEKTIADLLESGGLPEIARSVFEGEELD
jgi:hypothetical protein